MEQPGSNEKLTGNYLIVMVRFLKFLSKPLWWQRLSIEIPLSRAATDPAGERQLRRIVE